MHMQRNWVSVVLFSIFFTALISACGSGGGDVAPAPSSPATSAEGLWNGTSSNGRTIAGLVLDDGTYWFLYSVVGNPSVIAGAFQGNSSSQNGSFTSSNGKDFNLEGLGILDATVNGSYVMKQSLSGTIAFLLGGQTTFNSTYNADYDLIPNVNLVVGTYTGSTATTGGTEIVTVTLSSPNSITGSSASGCNFTGSFSPRTRGNVYDVSVTFAGGVCSNGTSTVTGVAFFDAATKRLYSAALNSTRTNGFIYFGTKPSPVALDFSGTFGGGGTATGSFTYDKTAKSLATNVRGLAPNATYPLTAWTFTVTGATLLPSSTFINAVPGHTAELCVGTCVFSAAPVIELSFLNDSGLLLQLTFDLLDPSPLSSPPADLSEWGGMKQSLYRIPCPVCVPVEIFQGGTLTASPP
jgi:hypothetical protein